MFNNDFNNLFYDNVAEQDFRQALADSDFDFGEFNMADFDSNKVANLDIMNPNTWGSLEILNWICSIATNNNINYEHLNLDKYANITNKDFVSMSESDFIEMANSPTMGKTLYQSTQNFLQNQTAYTDSRLQYQPSAPKESRTTSESSTSCEATFYTDSRLQHQPSSPNQSQSTNSESSTLCETTPKKRGVGRPRTKTVVTTKPDKHFGKLWEFLRNLLFDEKTCPSLIKWDDYSQGRFKFVRSDKIAQLWGSRRNNKNMNYEKFSRALRYHYKLKVLEPVIGKRLVYKFGPRATGWSTPNPILDTRRINSSL